MDIVDIASDTSEEYEDFHPSNLLEVVVKETESSESDFKNEYYSTFSEEPSSDLFSGFHHLNPSPIQDYNDFQPDIVEPKKALYWRVCSLCKFREIGGKETTYSYHRFPADKILCEHWKKICNFSDSVDVTHLKICSRHFTKDDFIDPDAKSWGHSLKLKPRAVPSQNIPSTSTSEQSLPITSGQQENLIKSATSTSLQPIAGLDTVNKPLIAPNLIREENKMHGYDVSSSFGSSYEGMLPMTNTINQEASEPKVDFTYWRYCFLCKYREPGGKQSSLSFHKFPSDEKACKLWKQVCNLSDIDDVAALRLCSKHFHPEDYINIRARHLGGLLRLKPGTVPSVNVPNPLSAKSTPAKYFILSNVGGQTPPVNGIQPGRVLNLLFRDSATGAIMNQGVPLRTVMIPNGKNLVPVGTPAPKIVEKSAKVVEPKERLQKSSSDVAKQALKDASQKSSLAKKVSSGPTPKDAKLISQPQVLIKRLTMEDVEKFQKGLITEHQLIKILQIKEKPQEIKSVAVPNKRKKDVDLEEDCSSDLDKNEGNQKSENGWKKKKLYYRYCYLCEEFKDQEEMVSLHKFPSNPELCKEWVKACNLTDQDDLTAVRICSLHFKPEDLTDPKVKASGCYMKVKSGAIPCIKVPNAPEDPESSTGHQIKSEPSDEFDPSNLLEVVVNETGSSTCSVDVDVDSAACLDKTNSWTRSCFLCEYKEKIGIQSPITMHRFPHDTEVNRLWKKVCNLIEHDYMNTSSLLICSNHFVDEDYIGFSNEPGCPRILKPSAVPSISVPNPLKSVESSKPSTVENSDGINSLNITPSTVENSNEINPPNITRVTLEPKKPKKQIVNPVKVNLSKINDVSNQSNSSGKSQDILQAFPKPQDFSPQYKPYHHIVHNQRFAVHSKNMKNVPNPNGYLAVRDPKQSYFSQFKLIRPAPPEGAVPKFQPTMENTTVRNPLFLANSFNWPQPVRILNNYGGPRLPMTPPVAYTMAPPGLFVHPQTLRKPAQVADSSSQTHAAAWQVERSCQTDEECNDGDDMTNEVIELDDSPPLKKRRLSLSSAESSSSESTEPTPAPKEGQLKRLRDRNLGEEQTNRIKQRINSLDDLLCHLQKRDLLSKDASDFLMNSMSEELNELYDLISKKLQARGNGAWDIELRTFAVTLRFFSVDAYNYVNNLWPNLVPCVSTIKKWFSVGNAKPGFSQEALDAIYLQSAGRSEEILCNLTIGEMTLQQEKVFKNDRFYGGVDMGTGLKMESDSFFEAQSVLVFFVTALNASWSIPVGYFFIKSLNAKERANLLEICLELLHEVCANVISITLDGSLMNTNMCTHLGANFLYDERFQPWFLNPVTREKIFVFYDACSMMKLVRDALGDKDIILDSENKFIKWAYIKKLCKVQSELPWEVDTKLTESHMSYQDKRMDIKISLQTLSRSVYKAFMSALEKNMEAFEGCYSTAVYCLMFNNIFDMLNCKNGFSKKKYRVPANEDSIVSLRQRASVFIKYILGLKNNYGTPLVETCRKTGFLGLIASLTNIFELYEKGKSLGLKHLLTHKLSLDNVRTFFSAMHKNNVRNGYLSAKEFECVYRKLILKCSRNFENIDYLINGIDILRVSSVKENYTDPIFDYNNRIYLEGVDRECFKVILSLKPIIGDVIKYMSGFVVNKILSRKLCLVCAEHLTDIQNIQLLLRKEHQSKYVVPSDDVYRICKIAEMIFQENGALTVKQSNTRFLVLKILEQVGGKVFDTAKMKAHLLEQGIFDNHLTQLCHLVIETFLGMRMFVESGA